MAGNSSDATNRTYSVADLVKATGGRKAVVEEYVSMLPKSDRAEDGSLTPLAAAGIGAVMAVRQRTKKQSGLRELLATIITGRAGGPASWLVVKERRLPPRIVEPPFEVSLKRAVSAVPMVFDPLDFLERLDASSSEPE